MDPRTYKGIKKFFSRIWESLPQAILISLTILVCSFPFVSLYKAEKQAQQAQQARENKCTHSCPAHCGQLSKENSNGR